VKVPVYKNKKILSLLAAGVVVIVIILLLQSPGPDQTEGLVPAGEGPFSSPSTRGQDEYQGPADTTTVPGLSGYTSITEYQAGSGSSGSPANFEADRASGTAPLTVRFTDTSAVSPDGWFWDFDDGSTSREQNPVHTFFSSGTYRVTLTVTSGGQSYVKTMTLTATTPAVTASFTAYPASGTAPLKVDFTDRSSGSPTSWSWSFGDGGTSTLRHPSHMYTSPGTYRVVLVVERDGATATKSATITVQEQSASTSGSFVIPATPTQPPTAVPTTVKATAIPTIEGKPVPTTSSACSRYSYTINGRTVSGTCCGSLSSSMQCSGGVCRQTYTCNGVPIG
jgi:PKD repeat protein